MANNSRKNANITRKFLLNLYNKTYGPYIMRKFNVKVVKNESENMEGSYVLLANHVTDYDAFFIQQLTNRAISYVVNDKVFRIPVLGRLMAYLYMIPKRKFSNDIKTVREILKAKNRGDIIGIFPEGKRSWDGNTVEIVKSTSSLVKSLKIPVVTALIKGGSAEKPRWDNGKIKKGAVEIEILKTLSKNEIKELSVDEIHNKITKALTHNEAKYILQKGIKLKGKNLAMGVERFLFACPDCEKFSTIKSQDDTIFCSCGYKQKYTNNAQLIDGRFNNIGEWSNWQKQYLKKYIVNINLNETIFTDNGVNLYSAKGNKPFKLRDKGNVITNKEKIVFEGKKIYEFKFDDLKGPNIQSNNIFEFIIGDEAFRLKLSRYGNAFKYQVVATQLLNLSDYLY